MPHKTPPHPTKKTITYLKSLSKANSTTVVLTSDIPRLAELRFTKAIIVLHNVACKDGLSVVRLGGRRGSLAKLKVWIRTGSCDMR